MRLKNWMNGFCFLDGVTLLLDSGDFGAEILINYYYHSVLYDIETFFLITVLKFKTKWVTNKISLSSVLFSLSMTSNSAAFLLFSSVWIWMVLSGMSIDSVDRILWWSNLKIEKKIFIVMYRTKFWQMLKWNKE